MAVTITHAKVSTIADDSVAVAAGKVVPSDWNASHSFSGTLDIANGGTGATDAATALINLGAIDLAMVRRVASLRL